jgi:hypothetical protein
MSEQIICIFCWKKADAVKQGQSLMVICEYCNRETELDEYQKTFDQWLGDISKEADGIES